MEFQTIKSNIISHFVCVCVCWRASRITCFSSIEQSSGHVCTIHHPHTKCYMNSFYLPFSVGTLRKMYIWLFTYSSDLGITLISNSGLFLVWTERASICMLFSYFFVTFFSKYSRRSECMIHPKCMNQLKVWIHIFQA